MTEKIEMTNEELEEKLKAAHQRGASIFYSELLAHLFGICEVFANQFRPQDVEFENFLAHTINSLAKMYKQKYPSKEDSKDEEKNDEKAKEEEHDEESKEAPEGRHEDVCQGEDGRQEATKEDEKEVDKLPRC